MRDTWFTNLEELGKRKTLVEVEFQQTPLGSWKFFLRLVF